MQLETILAKVAGIFNFTLEFLYIKIINLAILKKPGGRLELN